MAIVGTGAWDADTCMHCTAALDPYSVGSVAYGFGGKKCIEVEELPGFLPGGGEGFGNARDLEQKEPKGKVPVPELGRADSVLGLAPNPACDPAGYVVGGD